MRILDPHDVIVIGAGVIGLSVARSLATAGRRVLVIEREVAAGRALSSRSSGVVHAGLHHPEGWLKSRLARRGRPMLYTFCARHGVPIARTGKWIVACDDTELPALEALEQRARSLHLTARIFTGDEVLREEPCLRVRAALLVEETGVVRTSELVLALVRELEAMGGELLIGVEVERVGHHPAGIEVLLRDGPTLRAAEVVVASGLRTEGLLRASGIDVAEQGLRQHYCKGEWMALSERHRKRVARHVYPLPHGDGSGLGIHLTRDLDGYLYAGPDVTWQTTPDEGLSVEKIPVFGAAVRRYMPDVPDADLHPMMAGIRPKLSGEGEPARDFAVWSGRERGWPGLTALAGIESPGLTACLALGDHVASLIA